MLLGKILERVLFVTATRSAVSEPFGKRVVIDFQLSNLKVQI